MQFYFYLLRKNKTRKNWKKKKKWEFYQTTRIYSLMYQFSIFCFLIFYFSLLHCNKNGYICFLSFLWKNIFIYVYVYIYISIYVYVFIYVYVYIYFLLRGNIDVFEKEDRVKHRFREEKKKEIQLYVIFSTIFKYIFDSKFRS